MNIKNTQNTQENAVEHSYIEFSIFQTHAILQLPFSIKTISLPPLTERDRTWRTSGLLGTENYMKKARFACIIACVAHRRYAKHVVWFARKILYII